MPFSLTRVT